MTRLLTVPRTGMIPTLRAVTKELARAEMAAISAGVRAVGHCAGGEERCQNVITYYVHRKEDLPWRSASSGDDGVWALGSTDRECRLFKNSSMSKSDSVRAAVASWAC